MVLLFFKPHELYISIIYTFSIFSNLWYLFDSYTSCHSSEQKAGETQKRHIGENVSKKDKVNYLVNTVSTNLFHREILCVLNLVMWVDLNKIMQLLNLNDSKEAVYGALDAWVAWEQKFPMVSLRRALIALEKEQQWHRVVQVWIICCLSLLLCTLIV